MFELHRFRRSEPAMCTVTASTEDGFKSKRYKTTINNSEKFSPSLSIRENKGLKLRVLEGNGEHAVAQLVEALHYKSEGRGIDSRWCHWNFALR